MNIQKKIGGKKKRKTVMSRTCTRSRFWKSHTPGAKKQGENRGKVKMKKEKKEKRKKGNRQDMHSR